jgi:hypothetical protein
MIDNLTELKKELESGELSKFNEDSRAYINQLIHDAIGVMEELTCGDDRLTRYGVINNVFSKPAE